MQTIKQLVDQLDLRQRAVCVHAALGSLSPKIDGDLFIDTLLDAGCTVMAPTFTYFHETSPSQTIERNGMSSPATGNDAADNIFDIGGTALSRPMGIFPSLLLARAARTRGNHPLNSFTAVGPASEQLIADQNEEDVYAPLQSLTAMDGRLLLIGTTFSSLTFIHYAEQQSGRKLFVRWARSKQGNPIRTRVGSCSNGFLQLEPALTTSGTQQTYHGARWWSLPAKQTLSVLTGQISSNPNITRCADQACTRCRDAIAGGPIE